MNVLNNSTLTLNDVCFGIKMENIYTTISGQEIKVSSHKCLVNARDNLPISIVSDQYRLITNKEAYEYGVECLQKLSGVESINIEIKRVISNSKYSVCHIDLLSKGLEITVFDEDLFFPFVRITNSYNGTRSLRFDFGFIRQWCENGAIMETEVVSINLPHTKNKIKKNVTFEFHNNKFDLLKEKFISHIKQLKDFNIDQKYFVSLFFKAFELNIPDEESGDIVWANYYSTYSDVVVLNRKYIDDLGQNGYSLFNVLTEYASSRIYNNGKPSLNINTLQIKAGKWLNQILIEKQEPNFNLESYLGNYNKLPETVS